MMEVARKCVANRIGTSIDLAAKAIDIHRIVDARDLHVSACNRWASHLGLHRENLAAILAQDALRICWEY